MKVASLVLLIFTTYFTITEFQCVTPPLVSTPALFSG